MTINRSKLWFTAVLVAVAGATLFGATGQAHAYDETFNLTSSGDCATIGLAVWDGVSMRPGMCVNDSTMVPLRSDNSGGQLNQDVVVVGLGGVDQIRMVPQNSYSPPSSCDCASIVSGSWYKMQYDGHILDIRGGSGSDVIEGAVDDGDTWVYGDGGNDIIYNYSSVGHVFGNNGYDDLVSDTSGGDDALSGGGENDCLWDTSNSADSFDCGGGSNDYYHQDNSSIEVACENSTDCCGIC